MTNILNYILGGLLAFAVITSGVLWFENNSLEKDVLKKENSITTLTVQRDALQRSNDDLKKAIDTQNGSLARLEEIQGTVTALFTGFNASLATTNKQIAGIKEAVSKEKPPATCKDTIQYLKDARKELK
jgi:predicted  nucleic acid-binding Zn-ribbon protein